MVRFTAVNFWKLSKQVTPRAPEREPFFSPIFWQWTIRLQCRDVRQRIPLINFLLEGVYLLATRSSTHYPQGCLGHKRPVSKAAMSPCQLASTKRNNLCVYKDSIFKSTNWNNLCVYKDSIPVSKAAMSLRHDSWWHLMVLSMHRWFVSEC